MTECGQLSLLTQVILGVHELASPVIWLARGAHLVEDAFGELDTSPALREQLPLLRGANLIAQTDRSVSRNPL